MRLGLLCTISMRYVDGSWHRPYGSSDDGEGLGFGHGDGSVSGEIAALGDDPPVRFRQRGRQAESA